MAVGTKLEFADLKELQVDPLNPRLAPTCRHFICFREFFLAASVRRDAGN